MDLKSGYPYWPVKNGLLADFPPLAGDMRCDVVVVGAGISGALIARSLREAGLDVVVLDKRDAASGSTAATTALLQYEIDDGMLGIAKHYGEARAAEVFKACEQALHTLEPIAKATRGADFKRNQSLYYASWPWHAGRVRDEGEMRLRNGFALEMLDRDALHARFGIDAAAALLTKVAARMDPQRVAIGILQALAKRGCAVFDRTNVERWESAPGGLLVHTDRDASIRCKHLVLAAGYEGHALLRQRVARNHSSYALVTEPIADAPAWLDRTLVWESRTPYLYMRSAGDRRLIIGGEDDRIDLAAKRDRAVGKKTTKILAKLGKLLGRDDLEIGYAWAGTFAETEDALPFFGPHKEHGPRVHFAMAYGGNGIVYSVIGAELIRKRIVREKDPLMRFLSFDRLE